MSRIHATAVVAPGARIGSDVTIGPFACIEEDVAVGDRCRIGPHVTIMRHTTLGEDCEVHAGAVLGDAPQDLAFAGVESVLTIGRKCIIREGVTLNRGTKPGTATAIGDGCFLMAFSHCGHNVVLGERVILANGVLLAGYVTVGDRVFIGGNAAVHQFCRIGRLAMVGGLAAVTQDVPPFTMVATGSVSDLAGLNTVGLRRAGVNPPDRAALKRAYHVMFRAGLGRREALRRIREAESSPLVDELCGFIEATERGVCGETPATSPPAPAS
jgi:UDP-N-acetylglucosamine acyltransferase